MYSPFNSLCSCGAEFAPYLDPTVENTVPLYQTSTVILDFFCQQCGATDHQRYTIPALSPLEQVAFYYLSKQLTLTSSDLTTHITLTPSNLLEADGIQYALEQLEEKELIREVDWSQFSFCLTMRGLLTAWHGVY